MKGSLPFFPWGRSGLPQLFKVIFVPKRVHCMPEAVLEIGRKIAFACQRLHRAALPHDIITRYVIENFRREDEKSAVNPTAVAARLFFERRNPIFLDVQGAESSGRLNRRDSCQDFPLSMKFNQL